MSMEQFTKDMNIIAKLDNEPNDMGGLTAEQLKAKFDEGGLALQKYINEVILPRMGEPWQGDLLMNGYRVTNLGAPVEGTDALRKMDAAPAGYTERYYAVATAEDFDSTLDAELASLGGGRRKVIRMSGSGTCPLGGGIYMLTIDKTHDNYAVVDIVGHTDAGRYFKRAKRDGVWDELEWVNPPLNVGVEYRTTERYLGKPVYVKVFDFGALPNASYKSIAHGLSKTGVVSLSAVSTCGKYYFPSASNSGRVDVYINAGNIQITTTGDWSSVSVYVTVKYTKD